MRIYLLALAVLWSTSLLAQPTHTDSIKTVDLKEVVVSALRATEKTPMTFQYSKKRGY